ncbi:MAG: phospholipid carrier-dependent glycosyltransferase, partial [Elusimicrobia bacterium]|nr:phospholipid carrier-dependent glycosyltransferase [Elusimicrobiota bacterium]
MRHARLAVPPRSVLVLTACALLVLAFAPAQYFGRQQDDLLYYLGAQALARGRYCLETSPGCPPLVMINPGWPLLLLPLARLTARTAAFRIFSALILAAAPAAVWAWLRRRTSEATALLGAVLFASSPIVLSQSGVAMSEAPYLLVCLAALSCAEEGRAGAV